MSFPAGRGDVARTAVAALLGAGVAASGFTPLNHANDVLNVSDRPLAIVLTPPVLLALIALGAAAFFRKEETNRFFWAIFSAAVLLILAGTLSVGASGDPTSSTLLLISGFVAPLVFTLALLRADLPRGVICGAFLATTAILLIRADIVFLVQNGLPTPEILLKVKMSADIPYDFHYYTLNNPNYTSAFLIVPLALAGFWAADPTQLPWKRLLLAAVAGLVFTNLILVWVRFGIVLGAVVLFFAVMAAPLRRATRRWVIVLAALAGIKFFSDPTTWQSFASLTENTSGASQVVRFTSIEDGLGTLLAHPLAGVGLGRYGIAEGLNPAHSSIIQAGAETGILGFVGATLLTAATLWLAWNLGRRAAWRGIVAACALAAAAFCVQAAIVAGPPSWLTSFSTAIWGLSLGLMIAGSSATAKTEVSAVWLSGVRSSAVALGRGIGLRAQQFLDVGLLRPLTRPPAALALYGVISALAALAIFAVIASNGPKPPHNELGALRCSFAALADGAPPLVSKSGGSYLPVSGSKGLFLAFPELGSFLGLGGPTATARFLFFVGMAIAAAVAAFAVWRVWRSAVAALAAPPLLFVGFRFMQNLSAPDALAAVTLLIGLLTILALDSRWTTRARWTLAGIVVIAGLVSILSPLGGVPLLLAALVVVIVHERGWRVRAGVATMLVAIFALTAAGPLLLARNGLESRGVHYGISNGEVTATGGPLSDTTTAVWEGAYFGLGWFDGSYGIDSTEDPSAYPMGPGIQLGPGDVNGIRADTLHIIKDDPGHVASITFAKAVVAAGDVISHFPLLLLVAPLLLVLDPSRRLKRQLAILAPALLFLLAIPALASPVSHYEAGLKAAVGALWLVASCGLLAQIGDRYSRPREGLPRLFAFERRRAQIAAGLGCAAALLITSAFIDRLFINPRSVYVLGQSATIGTANWHAAGSKTWRFSRGLPPGWRQLPGVSSETVGRSLQVSTLDGGGYQLLGPTQKLPRGAYEAVARGSIPHGGLYFAVLDLRQQVFLGTTNHSELQSNDDPITMGFKFAVRRRSPVKLLFGNWNARNISSTWAINRVAVIPLGQGGGESQPPSAKRTGRGAVARLVEDEIRHEGGVPPAAAESVSRAEQERLSRKRESTTRLHACV